MPFAASVWFVSSGGNFDFERLPEVKERAQRYSGVKKYLILRMPQRPGALKEFLNFLGPDDDITRFEYLKKSARNFGSILIGIETKSPEQFEGFFNRLDAAGFTYSDANDETMAQFVIWIRAIWSCLNIWSPSTALENAKFTEF